MNWRWSFGIYHRYNRWYWHRFFEGEWRNGKWIDLRIGRLHIMRFKSGGLHVLGKTIYHWYLIKKEYV